MNIANGAVKSMLRAICLCEVLGMAGCKLDETGERMADHRQREQACSDSMVGKRRVPIIGGGEIDATRFSFFVPQTSIKDDGECGAIGFSAEFYWTGKKIVTAAEVPLVDMPGYSYMNLKMQELPAHWRLLSVAAKLGNRRLGKACKAHFDPTKCPDPNYRSPSLPSTWPAHQIVRLKAYPGLEMWLEPVRNPKINDSRMIFVDWPRRDGLTPRNVNCWSHEVEFPISAMTIAELEQLDFGTRTFPCDVEADSFDFKGGAARIHHSTALLPSVVPALRALQQYLSDSILRED